MKKVFILIIVLILAGFSCKDKCKIDKPKNIKPIDWENYNDTHTVYWNCASDCDKFPLGYTGKTIKMHGWIYNPQDVKFWDFTLLSDSLLIEIGNPKCAMVRIQCWNKKEHEAIQAKFDTSDLTKKCYVTGELVIFDISDNSCCVTISNIFVEKADDIYFE